MTDFMRSFMPHAIASRAAKRLLLLAALLCLSACALTYKNYPDPKLPPDQVAFLAIDRQIQMLSVDGNKTGIDGYMPLQNGVNIELTPGPRALVFVYSSTTVYTSGRSMTQTVTSTEPFTETFVFEKGHRYEMHYQFNRSRFEYRIVDVTASGSKKTFWALWGHNPW